MIQICWANMFQKKLLWRRAGGLHVFDLQGSGARLSHSPEEAIQIALEKRFHSKGFSRRVGSSIMITVLNTEKI